MKCKKRAERKQVGHATTDRGPHGKALRYVKGGRPGITRRRCGKGWIYLKPDGTRLTDAATIRRIRNIGFPPAYTDVWICPHTNGHVQATGRDAKGRKQYAYHPRFLEEGERGKYAHLLTVAQALPAIRERLEGDLRRRGLPREKVLAAVVRLLEMTMIRIGNADYEKRNGSYGLTTLQSRHLLIQGSELRFRFRGKAARQWNLTIRDRQMAGILEAIRKLPGRRLFQYVGMDGKSRAVTSSAVNAYLRDIGGVDVTAKDFRTWHGTVLTAEILEALGSCDNEVAAQRNIRDAISQVAARLGNTTAVCRRCYVHPQILASYLAGTLDLDVSPEPSNTSAGLEIGEARVLAFLQQHANDHPWL